MTNRFSRRYGYDEQESEITVRHEAPAELRTVVVEIAYECGVKPTLLRSIVCRVLRVEPHSYNWSDFPNVDEEVRERLHECDWYYVYDIIEQVYAELAAGSVLSRGRRGSEEDAAQYADEMNRYFRGRGIGWQLVGGQIEVRGPESFEEVVKSARGILEESGRRTAANELHESLRDLSRMPEPDVTGAIQHAMAALECAARDIVGKANATLGDLVKRNPDLFPKPLDEAVHKMWGYASETGRHLKEGKEPSFEEAELLVGLSGSLCRFLVRNCAIDHSLNER